MQTGLRVGMLLISLLLFSSKSHAFFTSIDAVVNDSVTLLCEIVCTDDAKWEIFLPIEADIARCHKGTCSFEKHYQKRFAFQGNTTSGNISLLISPMVYNDVGSYRCSCGGKTSEVKLKVFAPTAITAFTLESVTLPCYGDTRAYAKDVQWKKDGKTVMVYNHERRTVTPGQGFEDRFFLSQEAFSGGDLSLHISPVLSSDAGFYMCSINEEFREGEPRAVLLTVEEKSQCLLLEVIIPLAVALASVTVLAIYLCVKKGNCNNPDRPASTNPPHPVQEENQLMLNTVSDSSQTSKNSSTQPF